MARISLLFSLTFVLALGSLFLSVSSQSSPRTLKGDQNGDSVKSVLDRFLSKFGGYIKDRSHGRQLYVVASPPTNVKAAAPTGETTKEVSQTKFDKFMSYFFRDKNHGRKLYVLPSAPVRVNAAAPTGQQEVSQNKFDKLLSYFTGVKDHGRKLYVVPTRKLYVAPAIVKAWAPTGEVSEEVSQSDFDKFLSYFNILKAHSRKLYGVASPPNAAAPTTEELSQSEFDKFFSYINNLRAHSRKLYTKFGFGGKGQFDAAGKIKVAGRDGFKSLNRAHKNHFASREA